MECGRHVYLWDDDSSGEWHDINFGREQRRVLDGAWRVANCVQFDAVWEFVPQPIHILGDVDVMLRAASMLFALWPSLAVAQSYLVEPSLAACQARSAAQCTALGCDGVHTVYWWTCQALTSGGAAVVVQLGNPWFGVTAVNKVGAAGLNAAEQLALQTATQLGALLPVAVP